jgi:16S rRNA (guanine966-N2)-methyltransferase
MRITGGIHRGRSLTPPQGSSTRPTSDRARESIFNILRHGGWHQGVLEDATVLDVFAGTGALGLEALSQGAHHAVFIERDRAAAALCQDNIGKLGETARSLVLKCDAAAPTPRPPHIEPRSLVFLDPPYGKGLGGAALKALADKGWLQEGAVCVMEMAKKEPEPVPAGFTLMDERTYGIAMVVFLVRNDL